MKGYFRTIYEQYHRKVFVFVSQYIQTQDDVEDVVQEVFVHLWKHVKKLRTATDIDPIIFKTSKQEIANYYRKKKIQFSFIKDEFAEESVVEDKPDRIEQQHVIDKMNLLLDVIPKRRKTIFLQNIVDEMSYAQIASKHNISKSAVAKQIAKALSFLKANL